jgi:hypothetical protein
MNFFRESEKVWTKSALTLWKRFSGSGSTDWTHASQQTESTENEVNNGPSSYSLQRSDLEMLIPSWDTRYIDVRLTAIDFCESPRRLCCHQIETRFAETWHQLNELIDLNVSIVPHTLYKDPADVRSLTRSIVLLHQQILS